MTLSFNKDSLTFTTVEKKKVTPIEEESDKMENKSADASHENIERD